MKTVFLFSPSRLRKMLAALWFLCVPLIALSAQSAALEIEELLASRAVTYAQASRFVLEAADVAAFGDPVQAFYFARQQNWLPRGASAHEQAQLNGISLLLMRSFGLHGGFMFALTGAPCFAYREMEHKGFINGRASPRQMVSGEALLYLTGRIIRLLEY